MTTLSKDEIMAMAREAGIEDASFATPHFGIVAQFERFATLARADLSAENAALKADAERYRGALKWLDCWLSRKSIVECANTIRIALQESRKTL